MLYFRLGCIYASIVVVAALVCSGCGPKADSIKLYPVSGRVLFNDKPAAGAYVIFHPVNGPKPPDIPNLPICQTDKNGDFLLRTIKPGDGAPAGAYRVLIVWPNSRGHPERGDEDEVGDRLDGRYATPEATTLTAEVVAGTNELPPFVLK